MRYSYQPPLKRNWPSTVQYPSYTKDKRLTSLWLLILALISFILSVAALIVVFSVENRWFYDTYNFTEINNPQLNSNSYGLWRFCFSNQTCVSWFANNAPFGTLVERRLNQSQAGINAWQALEIIFLFLTTSTLIIAFVAITCYKYKKNVHYYLAILSGFCIWPAVGTGIAGLFVFGFSVYNVATRPRGLDWCFGVNIASVALAFIGAIFSSVYAALVERPIKTQENDTISDLFAGLNTFPTNYNPSPLPVVKEKKGKRKKTYEQSEIGYPNPNVAVLSSNTYSNPDYVMNPNHPMVAANPSDTSNQNTNPVFQQQQQQQHRVPPPQQLQITNPYRGSGLLPSASATSNQMSQWRYQPSMTSYPYEPPHWHRTETNPINYSHEPAPDYIQHGIYRPGRMNPIERTFERRDEPRVLHYYTGRNNFSAMEPMDVVTSRPPTSLQQQFNSSGRYNVNPPYYQEKYY